MDNREKEGKMEIQKFKYLKNKNSFLDEIKSIFQFLKGYSLLKKIKNCGHKHIKEAYKVKDRFLPSEKLFCLLPFKNNEKCFLFQVKSSFGSWDIYIFDVTF